MKQTFIYFISFFCGVLFALALGFSGMLNPSKVFGFLSVFHNWKPDLVFVLCSAVVSYGVFVFISKLMSKPLLENNWNELPKIGWDFGKSGFIGSAVFGIGWGLSGLCPGPAIVGLVAANSTIVMFVCSMLAGFLLFEKIH